MEGFTRRSIAPHRPNRSSRVLVPVVVLGLVTSMVWAGSGTAAAATPASGVVTTTVHVGVAPRAVAVDPSTHTAYVANIYGTVSVIDESPGAGTGAVSALIHVGEYPYAIAVDPTNHNVYVAEDNAGSGQQGRISVIDESGDARTGEVTANIAVGINPAAVAVDPVNHKVYVVNNSVPGTVSVIDESGDAHSGEVSATIAVGDSPYGVAIDPSSHQVYVTNQDAHTVSVIDESGDARTGTIIDTVAISGNPYVVAVDASTHNVYVTDGNGNVSVINESGSALTGTVMSTVDIGYESFGLAVDSVTDQVYASDWDGNTVSVIDESGDYHTGQVEVFAVGQGPTGVAVDPTSGIVSVANLDDNTVSVIDPRHADLAMTITGPPVASDGSTLTESITVINHGPYDAYGVTTQLLTPTGLTVVSAPGADTATNPVTWSDPLLHPGYTTTYTVTFRVADGVQAVAAIGGVTISSANYDPNPADNAAITTVRIG